jgi:hypothetical protein
LAFFCGGVEEDAGSKVFEAVGGNCSSPTGWSAAHASRNAAFVCALSRILRERHFR